MPWAGPVPNILGRFTSLQAAHRQDYQAIYNLLTNRNQTTAAVRLLAANLDRHSFLSFRDSLRKREVDYGFNFGVATAQGQLDTDVFRAHLDAGRPIDDLAFVGKKHGRTTHRAQWMMVALWNAANPTLQTPIIDLYRELGRASTHAQGSMMGMGPADAVGPPYVWDRIFDAEGIDNGTCPEYLNSVFIQTIEPGLFIAMR